MGSTEGEEEVGSIIKWISRNLVHWRYEEEASLCGLRIVHPYGSQTRKKNSKLIPQEKKKEKGERKTKEIAMFSGSGTCGDGNGE